VSSISSVDNKHVIYCDGGHNKATGTVAWACAVDGDSMDLLNKYKNLFSNKEMKDVELPVGPRTVLISNFTDVTTQQNNGAELLGMYAALVIAKHKPGYKLIKCDSQLIVEYWSKKLCPKKALKMDPKKVALIKEVIVLRKEFEMTGGVIEKISGDVNLADLGYH
jgi:ribonuclease HI